MTEGAVMTAAQYSKLPGRQLCGPSSVYCKYTVVLLIPRIQPPMIFPKTVLIKKMIGCKFAKRSEKCARRGNLHLSFGLTWDADLVALSFFPRRKIVMRKVYPQKSY